MCICYRVIACLEFAIRPPAHGCQDTDTDSRGRQQQTLLLQQAKHEADPKVPASGTWKIEYAEVVQMLPS